MTRVLFLAQRVPFAGAVEPTGAAVHAASTLDALRLHFDVLPLFGHGRGTASPRGRRLRSVVPARLRGMRQDARFVAEDRRNTREALEQAHAFRPDVIYERNEYFSLAGRRVARALGVPLVIEVNGILDLDMRTFYRSLGEPAGRRIERLKYRGAHALVTTSPTLAAELVRRGAPSERVHIVPNVVGTDRIAGAADKGADGERVVVGWLGHGLVWHGLGLLADAATLVAADTPSVVYRIVGGGPAVEELRERERAGGAARYEFAGTVASANVAAEIARFDIGVVPENPDERFPIKLFEMGAAGVAVAAPPVPCIADFLRPGLEFESFRAGDVEDLARAIRVLVADGQRRCALGSSLRERVLGEFTVEVAAERLRRVVEDVT